jgi:hypothetical protein
LEQAQADEKNADRLIDLIQQAVQGWDLTDVTTGDSGEEIEVPIRLDDREALKRLVPIPVFNAIVKAMREDQTPSGEA